MSYSRPEGIEQTLLRISRLIRRREAHLERAMDDFRLHFGALRDDFHGFFPSGTSHRHSLGTPTLLSRAGRSR